MNENGKVKKPSLLWFLSEGGRAAVEMGIYLATAPIIKHYADKGDGHPVLVVPGFMASNSSTLVLRNFLNDINYKSYGWTLGRNYGDPALLAELETQILDLYEETGEQISLIGWSLGGVFARQIAKDHPDKIRQIITLGSPFKGVREPNYANWLYDYFAEKEGMESLDSTLLEELVQPANVPTTAIYSKEDGIVSWKMCQEEEDYYHQNIQVRGAHIGLGHNVAVLKIIADRLQYSKSNWVKFESDGLQSAILFPSL